MKTSHDIHAAKLCFNILPKVKKDILIVPFSNKNSYNREKYLSNIFVQIIFFKFDF